MSGASYSLNDFDILRVIGKGYIGKVMIVRDKATGAIFALKSIHKRVVLERREVNQAKTERDILAQLVTQQKQNPQSSSPFLVRLHAAFQDATNLYYLMDYHGGGDLAGLLAQIIRQPEEWARLYAAEIVAGLIKLHSMNIIYRDLKPENILIASSGHLVLTDFGLCKLLPPGGLAHTFCGTPEYLAPEVLLRKAYGREVDWWSFGVLLFEMLVGTTCFWDDVPAKMYSQIVSGTIPDCPYFVSRTARDLIHRLLARDPQKRLSDDQMRQHPFFFGIDWDRLERLEYPTPYIPGLISASDTTAFDPVYTSMIPMITPDDFSFAAGNSMLRDAFRGFTFKP